MGHESRHRLLAMAGEQQSMIEFRSSNSRCQTHSFVTKVFISHWKPVLKPGEKYYNHTDNKCSKLHTFEEKIFSPFISLQLTLKKLETIVTELRESYELRNKVISIYRRDKSNHTLGFSLC